jgi:rhamnose transport system permease protein
MTQHSETQSATLIRSSHFAARSGPIFSAQWLLVLLIVVVIGANARLSPHFLDSRNISRTSSDFMELGLMMLPMAFIIITTGGVDLSVASNLGMCASFMGWLYMHGVNIWVAALAALILGSLAGFLNGTLVARLKLPPLVVTLGTYAFYRGVAYVLLGDQAARGYPEAFTYIGQGKLPGTLIPFSVALFVVLAVVFAWGHKTNFGRLPFRSGITKTPLCTPVCPWHGSRSSCSRFPVSWLHWLDWCWRHASAAPVRILVQASSSR